ncbi:MAG: cysteine--tRNA ligase, partial [Perlucidibaca sp.]
GDGPGAARHANLLRRLGGVIGLLQHDADAFRQAGAGDDDFVAGVEALVEEIRAARQDKDFQRSDALRDQLRDMGVIVEFSREGVRWRKAD